MGALQAQGCRGLPFRESSIRPTFPIGLVLWTLLVLLGGVAAGPPYRCECSNRSGQAWSITLAEGTREALGSLQFIDKFSGKPLATLAKAGDSIKLPAGARYLVAFSYARGGFFQDFILRDGHGCFAEYVASVPDLAEPGPVLRLQDQHVGPPLDRATDEVIQRAIDDAVDTGHGDIIILHDYL